MNTNFNRFIGILNGANKRINEYEDRLVENIQTEREDKD